MSAQASLSASESDAPMPADNKSTLASRHAYLQQAAPASSSNFDAKSTRNTTECNCRMLRAATAVVSHTLTSRLTKCKSGVSGRPRRTIDSYDCSSSCRSSSFSSSMLALPTASSCRAARATNKSSSSGDPSLEDCANAATQSQIP